MDAQCYSDPKSMMVALRYHRGALTVRARTHILSTKFGEIEVNPSDVNHVTELVGCSDEPGVVITAHTRRWCPLDFGAVPKYLN